MRGGFVYNGGEAFGVHILGHIRNVSGKPFYHLAPEG